MSNSKPLLVYWDIRGLAEPIRLILNYLEIDFEDRRIPFGELGPNCADVWVKQKYTLGLDFPNIPYYDDGEVKITQSVAILQHIGTKYNLYGDTLQEKAVIDMTTQTIDDLRWAAWVAYNAPNFHEIKDEWKKALPEKLKEVNKFLEGKDFVLGSKISHVDFFLYESMEWYRQFAMDLFETAPELQNLNNFQKRIEALPQIKAYLKSDKFKDWPFFGPFVYFGFSKDPDFKPIPITCRNFMAQYPLDRLE